MRFRTILIDPPWGKERGGGKICRGAQAKYPLMPVKDIIALPVKDIAEENAHLYLWTTNTCLPDALDCMRAWGFTYKTTITWYKDGNIGLGQYFRGASEHCLFGVRGVLPYKILDGKRQQGVKCFSAPRGEHSEKPEVMRKMIERVSYDDYLEIFGRKQVPGWTVIGDAIDGRDIRTAIKELCKQIPKQSDMSFVNVTIPSEVEVDILTGHQTIPAGIRRPARTA